ncbi:MAG TPA: ATP synthase F1 subunit gamma [Saprospiraceae bacterium]|nr:ATP synthase F1 subunit gamma [Saprospiraceae bacterium]HND87670.1 ATP synthase F1 subunit gamma [Saprospiraceae bacterium]HNG89822.1 ATP synthase F1 subunit gamma [Saprospiraceae bacterium]
MAGGLKEVRERIKSVINTQQITKAMKMVSAAKLRKAQGAITQVRPYADRLNRMLSNILSNMDGGGDTTFGKAREVKNVLVVVMTSNRGLAGAFNTNISKEAIGLIQEKYGKQRREGKVSVLFIGKKAYDYFRRRYRDLTYITDYIHTYDNPAYDNVSAVARTLMGEFSQGQYDVVELVYGRFKNAATVFPTAEQWLPVPKQAPQVVAGTAKQKKADYIFEPDQQSLLETLVPSILQLSFHKSLLDTQASEHGARMTAMDKATENAEELLKTLRINYNKARQEAITTELGEIVGGAAALEGA